MWSDTTLLAMLLVVLSGCAVIFTAVACLTARDVRRTLGRVNALLPTCEQAIRDVHRASRQAHRMLARSHRIVASIEDVIQMATQTVRGVLEPVVSLKARMESLVSGHDGNGHRSGSGPRRHHRA